jgi:yeast amino acid transporter
MMILNFWFEKAGISEKPAGNLGIYVTFFLAAIIAINYFGVGFFGEFEFWLSSAKVLVMVGLVIFTLVCAAGGAGNHEVKGFRYWKHPGAFAAYGPRTFLTSFHSSFTDLHPENAGGRFLGFWNVMSNAVFSYLGAELVGITVGEAQNPRKAIPRAVRLTFFRIVFFYLALILLLGMNVPYNDPELISANNEALNTASVKASPFVVAARIAGVNGLDHLINACLLIFTFSAANSDLYIATRSLYSLAIEGNAPRIFSRTDDRGVPIYALALSSLFCCSAYMCIKLTAFATFQYFVSLVTIFGILTWISILISHIYFVRARQAQGIPDTALAYVSPFGVRGSMAALIFACIITFFNGWANFVHGLTNTKEPKFDYSHFITDYLPVPIYLLMIFGYKWIMKTEGVKAIEADLTGGKAKIDEDEAEFLAGEMRRKGGMLETRWERLYRLTLGYFF